MQLKQNWIWMLDVLQKLTSTNVCAGWMMQTFVAGGQVVQWLLQQRKGHWFNSPPVYELKGHKDNFFIYLTFIYKSCVSPSQ